MSLQVKGLDGENLWVLRDGDYTLVVDEGDQYAVVTPEGVDSPGAFDQQGDMHFIDKDDVDKLVIAPPEDA